MSGSRQTESDDEILGIAALCLRDKPRRAANEAIRERVMKRDRHERRRRIVWWARGNEERVVRLQKGCEIMEHDAHSVSLRFLEECAFYCKRDFWYDEEYVSAAYACRRLTGGTTECHTAFWAALLT